MIQDSVDPLLIKAVAIPNFSSTSVTISSSVFTIQLPEGTTTTPAIPLLPANGSFTNIEGTWTVALLTPTVYGGLGNNAADLQGRDIYQVTLQAGSATPTAVAGQPIELFSFRLPNNCSSGSVEVMTNDGPIQQAILTNVGANFNNQMVASIDGASAVEVYQGNNPALLCPVLDLIAPAPPVIDPIDDTTDPITGTSEPFATINITGATCTNAPVAANAAGEWSCDLATPLAPGTVVTATATDSSGNTSQPTTTTVSASTTASTAPTIDQVNAGAVEISGTAAPGATIDLSGSTPSLTCSNAPVVADLLGAWSCTPTSTPATGDVVSATATEPGKTTSPPTTITVTDPTVTSPPPPTVNPTDGDPVTGTTIPNGEIEVFNPTTGAVLCSTTADVSGNFSCSPVVPPPSNGDELNVVVFDPVTGGVSNPTTVTVDQIAPAPPVIDPIDNTTNPITGTSEPGATIDVTGATCTNAPVVANGAGEWSCDLAAPLTPGTVVTATATDPAGNTSQPTSTTVSNSATASEAPTVNPVSAGATEINGTAVPGATIDLSGSTPGLTCSNAPVVANADGNWSCTPTSTPAVGNIVNATATEPGKTTSPPATTTVTDPAVTSPSPPTVNPTNGDPVTGTTIPNGEISVIDPTTGVILCTTTADASGNFSCSPVVPAPTHGQELNVVVTDPTTGGTSNPTTVTVDRIAPAPPVIDPIDNTTDPITGTSEPGTTIDITGATCTNAPVVANAAGEWSCDLTTPLAVGTVVTATATDQAGNTSQPATTTVSNSATASEAPTINLVSAGATEISGTAAPGATIDLSGSTPGLTCSNAPVVADLHGEWSCTPTSTPAAGDIVSATATEPGKTTSPPTTTTVTDPAVTSPSPPKVNPTNGDPVTGTTIPNGQIEVLNPTTGAVLCSTTADASGNFSCSLVVPAPTHGEELNVVVTDPTTGGVSNPTTVTVDQIAPAPPVIDPIDQTTDPITGTSEPGATIDITGATCTNAPVVANGAGEWSCDLAAPLTPGTVVTATATDPAGNTSQPATSTVSNSITASAAPAINPVSAGTTELSGTAVPGATIDLSGSTPSLTCSNAPVVADLNGEWSCTPTSTPAAGDIVSATATEPGKTASPPATTTVTDPAVTSPPPPKVNPTNGDPVTGTTIPNGEISIIDPTTGIILCTTTADASGNFSCSPVSPLPSHGEELNVVVTDPTTGGISNPTTVTVGTVVTATATDPAGNTSEPATTTVSNSATASEAPTVNPVSAGATEISGTAVPGATIDLSGSTPGLTCSNAPVVANADGNWSCTPTSTPAVGNIVSATATELGKTTSPPATTTVTDPAVTSPSPPTVNPTNGDPVTGTTIPNGEISVLDPTTGVILCTTTADASGNFSCSPVSPLPSHGEELNVVVTDPVTGGVSNPTTVTVDQIAPAPPVIDPIDETTDPITGTSEPGTTIDVTGATCTNAPVVANGAGEWSCDLVAPLTPGTVVTATATDPAGNTSQPATSTVCDSTTASEAPTINPVSVGASTINGTAAPGATIDLSGSTPSLNCTNAPVVADLNGDWSCTPTSTPAAGNIISATATEPGKATSPPATTTVTDPAVTAPSPPTVDPTDGDPVTGTTIPNGQIEVLDPTTGAVLCSTTADASGNFSCSPVVPAPSNGDELNVVVTDPVTGGVSNPTTVTVDQIAPAPPVIDPIDETTDPITGTSEPGATIDVTGATCTNAPVVANAAGEWICDLAAPLTPGTVVTATATDPAGNTSQPATTTVSNSATASAVPTVNPVNAGATTISGTAVPGATINLSGSTPSLTCSNAPVVADLHGVWSCAPTSTPAAGDIISATATEPGKSISPPATTTVTGTTIPNGEIAVIDPTTGTILCTTMADGSGNFSCSPVVPAPSNGDELNVVVTDPTTGGTSNPTTVTVDQTAPSPPVIDPIDNTTDPITGTSEPGTTIDVTGATCTNAPVVANAAGEWSCDLAAPLTPGTVVTAMATDPAGNTSQPATTTVSDSTTASEAPTVNPVSAGANEISGTAAPGATIDLSSSTPSLTCSNAPVVADLHGGWHCTPTSTPAAGDIISATATEPGKSISPPTTTTVTDPADTSPPPPTVDPTDGEPVTGATIPSGEIAVIDPTTGVILCTTTADASGNFSCSPVVPAPSNGDELNVVVTDPATNSTSNPTTVTVDQIAPTPPVIDPIDDTTDPITGTSEPGVTIDVTGATCTNGPVVANAVGEWSCDLAAPLTPGTVVTATATDPAGNTSEPATTTVSDSTTASEAPTLNPVSAGDAEISGTAVPGATIDLSGSTPSLTCSNAPVVADLHGEWSCVPTNTPTAGDIVNATATEPGKTASPSATTTVTDPSATSPPPPTVDPTDGNPVTGTTIPNGQIEVLDPSTSAVLCSTVADASGNFSCNPVIPAPGNGDELAVVAIDPTTGGVSSPTMVTVDQAAPSPPVIDPIDDTTNPITGTSEPGTTIDVTGATCTNAPVVANAAGEWSCDLAAPLTPGTVVTATATDPAGNTSQPAMSTVSNSATASAAPTVNPVSAGDAEISGTAVPGAIVDLSGSTPSLACSNAPVVADLNGEWSCTPTSTLSVDDIVSATATEPGKTTSPPVTTTVTDPAVTAPPPPTVDPTDGEPVTGITIPNGQVVVIDPVTGMILCSTTADVSGNFSCSPVSPLPTHGQELNVVVTDPVTGSTSNPTTVTVDQIAPAPPVIDPIDETTNPITGTSEPGATIDVTGATCTNEPVVANAAGEWSCDLAAPLTPDTVVTATATDPAGNTSEPATTTVSSSTTASEAPTVNPVSAGDAEISGTAAPGATIDLSGSTPSLICSNAPVVADLHGEWSCTPTGTPSTGDIVSATATEPGKSTSPPATTTVTDPTLTSPPPPTVDPTDGDPVTGTTIPNGQIEVLDPTNGAVLCSTTADGAGNFSCSPVVPTPSNGDELNVVVTDPATGGTSNPTTVTVDQIAPTPPVIDPIDETTNPITGTGEPGATIDVTGATCTNEPVVVDEAGEWSCDLTEPLTPGTVVTVTATDPAGNTSQPATTTVSDAPTELGSLGDYVWSDDNGDGLQNEPVANGVNGITVRLLDTSSQLLRTTVTANDGNGNPGYYLFDDLPVGTYIVEFVAPSGFRFTLQDQGAPPIDGDREDDSDVDPATGRVTYAIDPLVGGGCLNCIGADAGLVPDGPGPGDSDDDGLSDDDECPNGVPCPDTDNDDIPDYLDDDDDGDGILTRNEDLNNNGDWTDDDADNDNIPAYLDPNDHLPNSDDADGDGLLDHFECPLGIPCPDHDRSGRPDYLDTDSDNDDILDEIEGTTDSDFDGVLNHLENNNTDTDDDGALNHEDLDDDGDDIPTKDEDLNGNGLWIDDDADLDGIPAFLDSNDHVVGAGDADDDGIPDDVECPRGIPCPDTDGDGVPDYVDIDSDDDDILDETEGTTDSDGDGIPDRLESNGADTDGDGLFNHRDADDDGDDIPTAIECPDGVPCPDNDGDGIPGYLDPDDDGPGSGDSDGDGVPDFIDPDSTGIALGDQVWQDTNGNGLREADEPPLPGVTVTLFSTNTATLQAAAGIHSVVMTTTTDANGHYRLANLQPGHYYLEFLGTNGLVPTRANQGADDTLDSDALQVGLSAVGRTPVLTLSAQQQQLNWDAGFTTPVSLTSIVYHDQNNNLRREEGEPLIANAVLLLYDENAHVIAYELSDQDGRYRFGGMPPGNYAIEVLATSGFRTAVEGRSSLAPLEPGDAVVVETPLIADSSERSDSITYLPFIVN